MQYSSIYIHASNTTAVDAPRAASQAPPSLPAVSLNLQPAHLLPTDRADRSKPEARTVLPDFTSLLDRGGESDRKEDSSRFTSNFKVTL